MSTGDVIRNKLRRSSAVSILLFWFFAYPGCGNSASPVHLPDSIVASMARYEHAGTDSMKVIYLSRLAFFYTYYLEDSDMTDSLAEAAVRIAEMSLRPGLMILAYNNYLEVADMGDKALYQKAVGYGNKALQNCRITNNQPMRWRTCRNLALAHCAQYSFNKALSYSTEALMIAYTLKDNSMIAESYLSTGMINENRNQKSEAFRNYLIAMDMAGVDMDPLLLRKCYAKLSGFYRDAMLFDDAIECKEKEGQLIENLRPPDSAALMWAQYEMQLINIIQVNHPLNEQGVRSIINYAQRTGNNRLKNWEFALYRQYLLETDQLKTLYDFYTKTYPREFANLLLTDPEMYFRVKAYFTELELREDSADYYFTKAETLIIWNPRKGGIYKANFYNRYGQFLVRHGRNKEAIEKFSRAYQLAEAEDYHGKFDYMLVSSRRLEALHRDAADYKNAWQYASRNLQIIDSINTYTKKDQLMSEAIKRERSQNEIAAEKNRQKIRQGNIQLMMMAGGVLLFIIVSLMVFRNYRIQRKLNKLLDEAKKQSDSLLLNILPHETAEELKATGKAIAKRFDEVTVMFTDFKDFTQASERMSAEELVDEINFYFTHFDNIITRYGIEKIKIIGDSYMCAAGLPVVNTTHAHDVVEAAMELQKFMIDQKNERSRLGKSFFELRIGIHSGPVVAGIVGLKKFAYDIWGDTVNTAARMENAGEPNKINVSGETYERVKDRFACTYRGKVAAKHKGQIDMYFINIPG